MLLLWEAGQHANMTQQYMSEAGIQVINTGSYQTQIGLAGDDAPKFVYRTIIAKNKHNKTSDTSNDPDDVWIPCCYEENAQNIDTERFSVEHNEEFRYPIQNRHIASFEHAKILWQHAKNSIHNLNERTNTTISCNHLLFLENVLTPKSTHVQIGEFAFEDLHAESVGFSSQQLCSVFASGRSFGIAIDIGETTTTICPVHNSAEVYHGVVELPIGGRTITQYLCQV